MQVRQIKEKKCNSELYLLFFLQWTFLLKFASHPTRVCPSFSVSTVSVISVAQLVSEWLVKTLTCNETTVYVHFLLLCLSFWVSPICKLLHSKQECVLLQLRFYPLKGISWEFLYLLSYKQLYWSTVYSLSLKNLEILLSP